MTRCGQSGWREGVLRSGRARVRGSEIALPLTPRCDPTINLALSAAASPPLLFARAAMPFRRAASDTTGISLTADISLTTDLIDGQYQVGQEGHAQDRAPH